MKITGLAIYLAAATVLFEGQTVLAQTDSAPKPTPFPIVKAITPSAKLSVILAANLNQQTVVSRENRQQAYVKLLEGQRYFVIATKQRSVNADNWILAKQSFQKAVELNPTLAEGYAALAEIALTTPPGDIEETIGFSNLAIRVQPNNFSGHRFLAFAHTIKSGLNQSPNPNQAEMEKAIAEWKQVTEISPRFAEAWAFLSELYDKTNKNNERIEALKKWQASAQPVDTRFYRSIMGGQASLAPDSITLKLGAALIKANRPDEAVEVLTETLADDPDNIDAVDLLKQVVENGDGKTSPATVQALQQAVYANPSNLALIGLLADVQSRSGRVDEAAKVLRSSIASLMKSDKSSAAALQISLGDIYAGANRSNEAVSAYEDALKIQEINKDTVDTEENREFATRVFSKIIQTYKSAGRVNEAKSTIQRARLLLGNDDLFADKQTISLLRETGRKQEALLIVRNLRNRMKDDYSLLRLEASVLTELGKVDEGVKLIKTLIVSQPVKNSSSIKAGQNGNGFSLSRISPSPYYDDFTNYIFVSSLYNQAKRGNDAIEAAKQAFAVAESEEKKQIASLSLATAQQTAGNYQSAEEILRSLLKKTPGNPVALNNLGYFLLERNEKFEEALSLIRQALDIDPTNASYLDSLGWAYFKLGKLSEAEMYLRDAARNDSASAAVFEHLGDVYQKQEKFALARAAWQKAINISSSSETAIRLKEKLASRMTK